MSNRYDVCFTASRANFVERDALVAGDIFHPVQSFAQRTRASLSGRYKAPVVAPEAIGAVCHYIHLNPVRARVVTLAGWPWTSLPALIKRAWSTSLVFTAGSLLCNEPNKFQPYITAIAKSRV